MCAARDGWLRRCASWMSAPGTGCLLLTLLCELPNAIGIGTDISEAALAVARDNARRLGVEDRAQWLMRNGLQGIGGRFEILVSNPPYVRTDDIGGLEAEVRCFDPWSALDGGDDGLDVFRRLIPGIPSAIPNGWVVLEVGYDQAGCRCPIC